MCDLSGRVGSSSSAQLLSNEFLWVLVVRDGFMVIMADRLAPAASAILPASRKRATASSAYRFASATVMVFPMSGYVLST